MILRHRGAAGGRGAAPRERIHLVSWAGFPNYGDELIAARWLRFLAVRGRRRRCGWTRASRG